MLYEDTKTAINMATANRLFLGASGSAALWETLVIIYKIAKDGPIKVAQLIDYMTMRQKAVYSDDGVTNTVEVSTQKISRQVRLARELFNMNIRCGLNGYMIYGWGVLRQEQFLQHVEKHEKEAFEKTNAFIAAQTKSQTPKTAKKDSSPETVEK